MTSATVIKDSISPDGIRLTTMEVVMHRFVLAEFNTHRLFSRNSASSRAIPLHKQIARLQQGLAYPAEWPQEKRGMQGGDPLPKMEAELAREVWDMAARNAISSAEVLENLGLHKSVINRILEPFMWHTVVVTATEWDGFWWQRCSSKAMPEMRLAAEAMYDAYNFSDPTPLEYAKWHLPYVDEPEEKADMEEQGYRPWHLSAARCARVSYLTQNGERDFSEDERLYRDLAYRPDMILFDPMSDPPHASPLEHVAHPIPREHWVLTPGNFKGWAQLRHIELGF